jgi:hypothetical protein
MNGMFLYATSFTGRGLDHWSVPKVSNLTEASRGSSSFRTNLCAWGLDLFGRSVLMDDLFEGTDCLETDTPPDLSVAPASPLCYPCGNPGTVPPSVNTTGVCFENRAQLLDAIAEY